MELLEVDLALLEDDSDGVAGNRSAIDGDWKGIPTRLLEGDQDVVVGWRLEGMLLLSYLSLGTLLLSEGVVVIGSC